MENAILAPFDGQMPRSACASTSRWREGQLLFVIERAEQPAGAPTSPVHKAQDNREPWHRPGGVRSLPPGACERAGAARPPWALQASAHPGARPFLRLSPTALCTLTRKTLPPSGLSSIQILPLCSSTIRLAIASPDPCPFTPSLPRRSKRVKTLFVRVGDRCRPSR